MFKSFSSWEFRLEISLHNHLSFLDIVVVDIPEYHVESMVIANSVKHESKLEIYSSFHGKLQMPHRMDYLEVPQLQSQCLDFTFY
jgi:D-ribose pyranose/furanose isomerase RbsD